MHVESALAFEDKLGPMQTKDNPALENKEKQLTLFELALLTKLD